jgi:protein-S-isoprenylcysteine O-methyltransferase Ste14
MKKKIVPDGYFFILIILSLLFHYLVPVIEIVPFPYKLIGIFLIVSGLLLTLSTNSALLKQRTSIKPNEVPDVFITNGPFKISRNPIYLGMTIILSGVEILLGSLSPMIFPVVFVIIINRFFISVEEKILENKFGENYLEYKKRVRRWI